MGVVTFFVLEATDYKSTMLIYLYIYIWDAIQQKVHKVGKRNFTRKAFKENEVEMTKIMFLQKTVAKDIWQQYTEVLEQNNA